MINMDSIHNDIKNCLKMFGPCMVITIQEKLKIRGYNFLYLEILNACEFLLNRNEIQEATGFHGRAFKL